MNNAANAPASPVAIEPAREWQPGGAPAMLPPVSDGPRFDLFFDGRDFRGMTLADLAAAGVPAEIVLGLVKDRLKAAVDAKAEVLRASFMTGGAGQAMEYQEAASQAFQALEAGAEASADRFPMLAVSIGIDIDPQTGAPAADVLGVARSVRRAYLRWQGIGSAIRGARLAGKQAIDGAATDEAALAAFNAIPWPTPG